MYYYYSILYNVTSIFVFSCVYYYFARRYGSDKDRKNFKSYEDTVYYTTITHFTVGLGDIAPESQILRRLTMLQVAISFYILKYTLSL